MLPEPPHTLLDSLAGYPRWLVAAVATIGAAAALWLLVNLLKWGLYVLLALVLIGGVLATGWLIFN